MFGHTSVPWVGGAGTQLPCASTTIPAGTVACTPAMFGHTSVSCVGGVVEPQDAFVKPSFEPGPEAGSLSMMSERPSSAGCDPVEGLWASVQAVNAMLMTT